MAQFQVTDKYKCLLYGVIAPCFEQHHSNGPAGEDVSNDQLCEDV